MKNVVYRGTVWSNLSDNLVFSINSEEPYLVSIKKGICNPAEALSFATEHYIKSGKNPKNPPCILAVDEKFTSKPGDVETGRYTIGLPILNGETRIINPLNKNGLDLLLFLIRNSRHPYFDNEIRSMYEGRTQQEAVEGFIKNAFMPRIKILEELF